MMWMASDSSVPPSTAQEGARDERAASRTRSCVACGERVPYALARKQLLRFVLAPLSAGVVRPVIDLRASNAGRGAWVHPRKACIERAVAGGFARSARTRVEADFATVVSEISAAARRRAHSLLSTGARAGTVVLGTAAVQECAGEGRVALAVVARDARAAAKSAMVRALGQAGRVLPYGDKDELGSVFGRCELGIVAIADEELAGALRQAIGLAETQQWATPHTVADGPDETVDASGLTPRHGQR